MNDAFIAMTDTIRIKTGELKMTKMQHLLTIFLKVQTLVVVIDSNILTSCEWYTK